NSSDVRYDVGKLVDRNHTVLTKVERFVKIGPHQSVYALNAVRYIAKRTRLFAVSPYLDLMITRQFRDRNFTAHCCRRFLSSSVPSSIFTKNIMETYNARLNAVIFAVMRAKSF